MEQQAAPGMGWPPTSPSKVQGDCVWWVTCRWTCDGQTLPPAVQEDCFLSSNGDIPVAELIMELWAYSTQPRKVDHVAGSHVAMHRRNRQAIAGPPRPCEKPGLTGPREANTVLSMRRALWSLEREHFMEHLKEKKGKMKVCCDIRLGIWAAGVTFELLLIKGRRSQVSGYEEDLVTQAQR
ncbi:hypothetical protein D4764_16G0004370 [Takifugu flavidus]|uniref:Uncharacterized protein n=1 Tax=Takifugu flavidus TaxID=433684 RepID=A0A5C6P1G1_9TELE|nr:hypothetical protein D4764_16G0004370 [Takifugu flavidus]